MEQQKKVLVALGATTGALAAVVLAHKLWTKQNGSGVLHVHSSSSWLPPLLLRGSCTAHADQQQQEQQHQLSPVVYDYAQSVEEVLIEAQLPAHIQRHDVLVKLQPDALLVTVGQQCVIDGCLAGRILPQHSSWKIEGHGKDRKLSITLVKQPAPTGKRYTLWNSLLVQADAPKSPDRRDQAAKSD